MFSLILFQDITIMIIYDDLQKKTKPIETAALGCCRTKRSEPLVRNNNISTKLCPDDLCVWNNTTALEANSNSFL